MEPYLSFDDVSYSKNNNYILKNISFSMNKGETLGLLGLNGAGKSTLLKICAGVIIPTSGSITKQISCAAKDIGFLPELPPLIPNWTVLDFLTHIAKIRCINLKNKDNELDNVIALCDLGNILTKQIKQLSKGNQQRVGIAQAIIHSPKIIILDEPTSGLDLQQLHNFRKILNNLKSNSSILFSSHIEQEINTICDRTIVLKDAMISKTNNNKQLIISFYKEVNASIFSGYPDWTNSDLDTRHYFNFTNKARAQEIIKFCISNNLEISSINTN